MSLPFVHRDPTFQELERFRLILSTYQDGTGMLKDGDKTLPGWRDFERSVAVAFDGQALESKWIYDVLLPAQSLIGVQYGISCKMRGMLRAVEKQNRVTVEVSNATGEFWDAIKEAGLTQENYHTDPQLAGEMLVHVVEQWHLKASVQNGGAIDMDKSFYLILQWDRKTRRYQLFQYPVDLPDPNSLHWQVQGRRLIGRDNDGILFEWYGLSGGQLKYYPLTADALWQSPIFSLEPLPDGLGNALKQKASAYFPGLWSKAQADI